MPACIYGHTEGRAEILWLYDEALSHLSIGHESKTVSIRYGETHVLSLGPEDAPPVVFLHAGNSLNPTCLRWVLAIAPRYRIHSPILWDSRARARSLGLRLRAPARHGRSRTCWMASASGEGPSSDSPTVRGER
jgi:hypothetical protein